MVQFKYCLFVISIIVSCRMLTYHYLLNLADKSDSDPMSIELDYNGGTMGVQSSTKNNYGPILPLRDESNKILSQACVRSGYGGVYLKHFRKAGGTSLMWGTSAG